MPVRAMKPCNHPGCKELVRGTPYCEAHERQHKRLIDDSRENSYRRGYNKRWAAYRKAYIQSHPLCTECAKHGLIVEATVVDHIVPHQGDYALMWEPSNHQALCARCHNTKTAMHDGGYGHERG